MHDFASRVLFCCWCTFFVVQQAISKQFCSHCNTCHVPENTQRTKQTFHSPYRCVVRTRNVKLKYRCCCYRKNKSDEMNHTFWEENASSQHVKYESGDSVPCCEVLAPYSDSESTYGVRLTKNRVSRQDPLSHRIIEKRRRDRMNNCLADLSRLIPAEYLKKGRGRVEKTEIIEMAIKHMKHLQHLDHYRLGYQECMSETMRFLVEVDGRFPREPLCVRLLGHLQQHCDSLTKQTAGEEPPKNEPNNNHVEETQTLADKHTEAYKYKTNIKLRFNQDLQHARRNSATSVENHSSNHSSPPSSEMCTRMSADTEQTQSDMPHVGSGGGTTITANSSEPQNNFNVPIFVLHSKGTFYVPLSIDYQTLLPFLHDWDLLEVHSVVLHPVTINVSFPTPSAVPVRGT